MCKMTKVTSLPVPDCGCSGRSTSCTYNEVKGYGVCDNCTENSTGEKCDHCIEDFFINPGTGEADPFCIRKSSLRDGSVSRWTFRITSLLYSPVS